MSEKKEKKGLNISTKSFVTAILVIFGLMVLSYGLTFVIPSGEYARTVTADGNTVIDTAKGFSFTDGGISLKEWALSPLLVLTADGSTTIIAVIIFLIVIGGVFNSLDKCGLMKYMLGRIVAKYGKARYKLMAVVIFFFMALGSLVGSFEECVPLVPIVVALSISLGWDALTGLGMSIIAVGCGFSTGVLNPFTVGVAQSLAGLPMFSGASLRILSFVLIYILLYGFVAIHAKIVAQPLTAEQINGDFENDKKMNKALLLFAIILGVGILILLSSAVLTFLQDYTMIIVAVMFLIAGIVSVRASGMKFSKRISTFLSGAVSILPAVVMILMASSIKYILVEAKILDTILYYTVQVASTMPKSYVILFIYLIVLVMNFFIASGSAKAFLLIPLIVPIAQIFGISTQLCILAYAFGDGFSNLFYPTNPVLLISLGLADVSYGKYVKWTWKFQLLNLILTSAILTLGLYINY